MRTHVSRSKRSSAYPLPQSQATVKPQSVATPLPVIQTKSNEEGLAEWEAQRQKWARIGTPWMDRVPNPSGDLVQPWIQRKLTIGKPNDKYEQEADRVASQVVRQINAPVPNQQSQEPSVQRHKELDEVLQAKRGTFDPRILFLPPGVQRKVMSKEEELQAKPNIPRRKVIPGGEASTDLASAINSARGRGQPLDTKLQLSMGQVMGADFSGIRVHTNARSDQLNQSIQAKAFTTGQDIFFQQGAYQPGNRRGQELIAHELTHVVQQKGGAVRRSLIPKQLIQTHGSKSKCTSLSRAKKYKTLFNPSTNLARNVSRNPVIAQRIESHPNVIQRADLLKKNVYGLPHWEVLLKEGGQNKYWQVGFANPRASAETIESVGTKSGSPSGYGGEGEVNWTERKSDVPKVGYTVILTDKENGAKDAALFNELPKKGTKLQYRLTSHNCQHFIVDTWEKAGLEPDIAKELTLSKETGEKINTGLIAGLLGAGVISLLALGKYLSE